MQQIEKGQHNKVVKSLLMRYIWQNLFPQDTFKYELQWH